MDESLKEFKAKVRKLNSPRKHAIRNSYGIREAFLYLQSHKWFDIGQSLRESQFQHIIRDINNLLAEEITQGNFIIFPENMGQLEVRRVKRYVSVKEGKIKTNYYVDWDKTLELWSKDAEAYKAKTLVRNLDNTDLTKLHYNKTGANYKNMMYFKFKGSRNICRAVMQNVKNDYNYGYQIY